MALISHVSLTRAEFSALVSAGTVLERPAWFHLTDALPGEPADFLGMPRAAVTDGASLYQPPKVTSLQRDAMRNVQRGTLIFNLTTDVFEYYSLTGWAIL